MIGLAVGGQPFHGLECEADRECDSLLGLVLSGEYQRIEEGERIGVGEESERDSWMVMEMVRCV